MRHPEPGAGHPDNFDDSGPADHVCDGCARQIYSGLLTRVDGKLLCERCEPLPTFSWNRCVCGQAYQRHVQADHHDCLKPSKCGMGGLYCRNSPDRVPV